ncbi:MAG TPA: hypothetical protein VGG39_20960 [Polyangiaceae bacterium]|jgi:hypothetical protein
MTKTTANLLVLCTLAGAVPGAALLACGGGQPKPADTAGAGSETSTLPEPTPIVTASAGPADSASAAPETPSPLAQVLVTDSTQVQKIFDAANTAPAATMKQNGTAGGDPLAKGIKDAAKKLPAGMTPEGPMAMGSIKEKQHLQTDVTLAPGKCYSIVGFSKKVKDLDLYLLLPPGVLSGQDLTDDNKPIIGGAPQPMCPVSAQPVTYKVDIYADTGSGDVAVQLYSKGK